MKTTLKTFIFILCVSLTGYAQNTQQDFINYQGVASNASGDPITNSNIAIQIALKFGNSTTTASYIENHSVTTDANGVFNLQIGNGSAIVGAYSTLNWGEDACYVTVSLNGTEVGTTEMVAVPYAISSGDSQWNTSGTDIENKNAGAVKVTNNLEVAGTIQAQTGAAITEFSTDGTLTDNSDTSIPTEQAVKTYVDIATAGSVSAINDLSDGKTLEGSIYLGEDAGSATTDTFLYNIGLGLSALMGNTTGAYNVAIGNNALTANEMGSYNTAVGDAALNSTIASFNTGIGSYALLNNTIGEHNTANGNRALYNNTTGIHNTASGSYALNSNTTGIENTANGKDALSSNTIGSRNTALGMSVLFNNSSGNDNTAVGWRALIGNTSGSGNVAIGYSAGYYETGSNKLYISNSTTFYPLIYGEFDNRLLTLNGATTIKSYDNTAPDLILSGTTNSTTGDDGIISSDPNYAGSDIFIRSYDAVVIELDYDDDEEGQFEIKNGSGNIVFSVIENGDVRVNGSLVHASDRRLKKDIEDLPYGLNEVLQLQPKAYNWKNRTQDHKSLGLIAQDVQPLIEGVVTVQDNEEQTLGISYTELIPVLINAIKEQQAQIEILEAQNKVQNTAMAEVLNRLTALEDTAGYTVKHTKKDTISLTLPD